MLFFFLLKTGEQTNSKSFGSEIYFEPWHLSCESNVLWFQYFCVSLFWYSLVQDPLKFCCKGKCEGGLNIFEAKENLNHKMYGASLSWCQ